MKTAKVFKNGRSLAVRLPKDWIDGASEVEMHRDGRTIVITPKRSGLEALIEEFREEGGSFNLERPEWSETTPPERYQL